MGNAADDREVKSDYSTPALEKGLDVIELLARQPGGLTKSQIARQLGRTVSEIFRMLVCLERRGYISHVAGDEYALTLRLFKLVQAHPPTERLIAEAAPVLRRFSQVTMQSCHMGVIEEGAVVILAQQNAPTSVGLYVKLGTSIDIMDASTGYVILAHQNNSKRGETLAGWKRRTGKEVPADLLRHLKRIRRKGYEERESYQVHGVINISFPIYDDGGCVMGALTTPYIKQVGAVVSRQDVVNALRISADDITNAIGGSASRS